jgi:hypothetical protein
MALSSLFLNSLPMDNSLAITHFGLLYVAMSRGGTLKKLAAIANSAIENQP